MRAAALAAAPEHGGRLEPRVAGGLGLAAACVLALVVAAEQRTWAPSPAQTRQASTAVTAPGAPTGHGAVRYATRVGERQTIALTDGSIVALDTASVLDVDYSAARRDVRLVRGQALFQVAKNRARPFVVTAGDRQITATGTAFDVRVDRGEVRVVLVEGRVTVTPIARSGLAKLFPALETQIMAPGEALVADRAKPVSVTAADVAQDTSWREGQVIFRDDTLSAAVAEMNRYSTNQIVVDDPRIAGLRISGVFGVSRQENFIAAVTAFYPIEVERRAPNITVLVRRFAWIRPTRRIGGGYTCV